MVRPTLSLLSIRLKTALRQKEVLEIACPFLREPAAVEAVILQGNLREERLLRRRLDILSFPDNILHERYRFSAQSIIYLDHLLSPHGNCQTHRGHALSLSFVFLRN